MGYIMTGGRSGGLGEEYVPGGYDGALGLPRLLAPLIGSYRRVGGHHIHQAMAYGTGRTKAQNPNFYDAMSIAHGRGFTRAQHRRADSVQRAANLAYQGRGFEQPRGGVRVTATGGGTLPPTPTPWFEDTKAFYALRSAGYSPDQALNMVRRSAAQMEAAGARPVRVPGG